MGRCRPRLGSARLGGSPEGPALPHAGPRPGRRARGAAVGEGRSPGGLRWLFGLCILHGDLRAGWCVCLKNISDISRERAAAGTGSRGLPSPHGCGERERLVGRAARRSSPEVTAFGGGPCLPTDLASLILGPWLLLQHRLWLLGSAPTYPGLAQPAEGEKHRLWCCV